MSAPPFIRDKNHWQAPLALLCVLGAALLLLGALASHNARPFNDSGGYEAMLRDFLQTGRVDYMKWSQPTFIGLLAGAVPWSHAFGANTASLQWLVVLYALLTLLCVWLFAWRDCGPWRAALFAGAVLLVPDAISTATTFQTDTPYLAYLAAFLLFHRELERAYRDPNAATGKKRNAARVALWAAWAFAFALSALTRSFSLFLVPVFGLQWLLSRRDALLGAFAARAFVGSALLAGACMLLIKSLGEHALSLREMTAVPLILAGDRARFDVRALLTGTLLLCLAIFPAMLFRFTGRRLRSHAKARGRFVPYIVGALALALGIYFWRKGVLNGFLPLPQAPTLKKLLGAAQLLVLPFAAVAMWRVLWRGVQSAWRLRTSAFTPWTPRSASSDDADYELPHTSGVLLAIIGAHFVLMPLLLHPVTRHLMPAGLALILLCALQSRRAPETSRDTLFEQPSARADTAGRRVGIARGWLAGAYLLAGVLVTARGVDVFRALSAAQFDEAERLAKKVGPRLAPKQIAGGWAWYCARDLKPGRAYPNYAQDYTARQNTALYRVWVPAMELPDANASAVARRERPLQTLIVPGTGGQTVRLSLRQTAASRVVPRTPVVPKKRGRKRARRSISRVKTFAR